MNQDYDLWPWWWDDHNPYIYTPYTSHGPWPCTGWSCCSIFFRGELQRNRIVGGQNIFKPGVFLLGIPLPSRAYWQYPNYSSGRWSASGTAVVGFFDFMGDHENLCNIDQYSSKNSGFSYSKCGDSAMINFSYWFWWGSNLGYADGNFHVGMMGIKIGDLFMKHGKLRNPRGQWRCLTLW